MNFIKLVRNDWGNVIWYFSYPTYEEYKAQQWGGR